ncbi:hypothetical protein [Methanohalobium evestigatum]|uniref:hypothetical protein n=1 Tax=Methanohalobium evestigatum TaxID=2322 RepID=UPI0006781936|nr:hypothetical protein [Methanohalobium evestigatum]
MKLFYKRGDSPCIVVADASGITSCYAVHYYSWRTDLYRKIFLKSFIAVDTDKQIIIKGKIIKKPTNDS